MNEFYYSANTNGAYPESDFELYKSSGAWPDDAVLMPAEIFREFFIELPPDGKMRAGGPEGLPIWVDIPSPTKEQLIAQAERQRSSLRAEADNEIAWRQDAVDLDMATEKEAADLLTWKKYRIQVNRVNTDTAPDINWPAKPQ
ncbi:MULTISPECIES: tail fiber assembly protein [Atlantibacter]|uniref:tail fiber assembly protein n=1 Tax=Atlantibacter TaxID=1903434 RepID=UPI000EDFFDA7|nr:MULTISPECIES: tail fiber assembly protein [Atlantibacter]HCC76675.1 phage tail protein [Shigella sp.]